jgi:hypothetical protein
MELPTRFELVSKRWQRLILPLNYGSMEERVGLDPKSRRTVTLSRRTQNPSGSLSRCINLLEYFALHDVAVALCGGNYVVTVSHVARTILGV